MIYVDAEGNQRHVKDADAKLVEREKEGVHPGKVMAILAGTHAGLLCQVLALEPKASSQTAPAICCVCTLSAFISRVLALEDRRVPCACTSYSAHVTQRRTAGIGVLGIAVWLLDVSGRLILLVVLAHAGRSRGRQ